MYYSHGGTPNAIHLALGEKSHPPFCDPRQRPQDDGELGASAADGIGDHLSGRGGVGGGGIPNRNSSGSKGARKRVLNVAQMVLNRLLLVVLHKNFGRIARSFEDICGV